MKRSRIGLADIADWHQLSAAYQRAARSAGDSPAVTRFAADLNRQLASMRQAMLEESLEVGNMSAFRIRDPKPRLIHAPCFRERVLHHAVMAAVGPVLERALVDDTYACRPGRGTLATVKRCQQHLRRFPWYAQIDIRQYFASIDHAVLIELLQRKFKDAGLLRLLRRIIQAYHSEPGKGLPIGALTSQHFANYYLAGLDRLLLETCRVQGLVRYMDDLIWFGPDRDAVRAALDQAEIYAREALKLTIKQPVRIGRSSQGLLFCGYRILPGALRLSRRGKRRYIAGRRRWETLYNTGQVDALALQRGYAAVLGATLHADAKAWRREQLRRCPVAGKAGAL